MDFITFCPDVMNMRVWRIYDRHFHGKSRKKQKNKIRPANAIFDGVMKPSVRGAVKNHNPRKGTETRRMIATSDTFHVPLRTSNPESICSRGAYGMILLGLRLFDNG